MHIPGEVTAVIGEQRGDEGKGRLVDELAQELEEQDIVARFGGGQNAGHQITREDGRVFKLHIIPSGIIHDHMVNVIGNGTVIEPTRMLAEIDTIEANDVEVNSKKLLLSSQAHLVLPTHICMDELQEAGEAAQGSTKSGIAQAYADKARRHGLRLDQALASDPFELRQKVAQAIADQNIFRIELGLEPYSPLEDSFTFVKSIHDLGKFVVDTPRYLHDRLKSSKPPRILAEGAQAFLLDVDHGMWPYVTSSATTIAGIPSGLGIPPKYVTDVVGVVKAIPSHVGGGPFVTEEHDGDVLKVLYGDENAVFFEKGTTTGRLRRLGHLDLPVLRRSQMINDPSRRMITKLDCLNAYDQLGSISVCTAYEINGQREEISPGSAEELNDSTPVYEQLPAWSEDISDIRTFEDLPEAAQNYVQFIEEKTGVPLAYLGVGPNPEQVIVR